MATRRTFLRKTAASGTGGIVASGAAPAFAKRWVAKNGITMAQAWAVHRKCLIIDGHNDTPVERVARNENPINWMRKDMSYHTDIPRMKGNGQQYTAFMIIGDGPIANVWITAERIMKQIELNPKAAVKVLSSRDAVQAGKAGKAGIILSIEGAAKWLEGRIETLHIFYRLGVRLVGITHGEGGEDPGNLQGSQSLYRLCTMAERDADRKNAVGLTPFGMEVLKAENELGIVTDTAHINDKAFYEVMEHSTRPPIMSHTGVFALCRHARCLTDDQIKALAAKGGVMGIAFAPMVIDADPQKATLDRVVDHILYAADLAGIDSVGIGTDYDGMGDTIPVVPEVSQLVNLTRAMLARGLTEKEIIKVWGGNFLRVMRKTIDQPGKREA